MVAFSAGDASIRCINKKTARNASGQMPQVNWKFFKKTSTVCVRTSGFLPMQNITEEVYPAQGCVCSQIQCSVKPCSEAGRPHARVLCGVAYCVAFLMAGPGLMAVPPPLVNSIVELQGSRVIQRLSNEQGDSVTLTNLNPAVGAWYVLELNIHKQKNALHLEVPALHGERGQRPALYLFRDGLAAALPEKAPQYFPLWGKPAENEQESAKEDDHLAAAPELSGVLDPNHTFDAPYTVICDGLALVRVQKAGSATKMEKVTDLLRATGVGAWFVETAKPYLIPAPEVPEDTQAPGQTSPHKAGFPGTARLDAKYANVSCTPEGLGIATDAPEGKMTYGHWYKAVHHPGVFISVMKASAIDAPLLETYRDRVGKIGAYDGKKQEADALAYFMAFDSEHFSFGYTLGAEHPHVKWSERAATPNPPLIGPDGFDTVYPLARIGSAPPCDLPRAAATFTGGFKREHASFKFGPLAEINHASHYGFIEQGVVFSRLQPQLATAWIDLSGSLYLLTWPEDGSLLFPRTFCARQNGVPLIEKIDESGISVPGIYVNQWGVGSWSGSKEGDFLTVRSALALQEISAKRFVFYAYFTGATPNAMARMFQAYGCRYALQLDMNSLTLCYAALYAYNDSGRRTGAEYLHNGMENANGPGGALRFLNTNDARDFFYVLRKK